MGTACVFEITAERVCRARIWRAPRANLRIAVSDGTICMGCILRRRWGCWSWGDCGQTERWTCIVCGGLANFAWSVVTEMAQSWAQSPVRSGQRRVMRVYYCLFLLCVLCRISVVVKCMQSKRNHLTFQMCARVEIMRLEHRYSNIRAHTPPCVEAREHTSHDPQENAIRLSDNTQALSAWTVFRAAAGIHMPTTHRVTRASPLARAAWAFRFDCNARCSLRKSP